MSISTAGKAKSRCVGCGARMPLNRLQCPSCKAWGGVPASPMTKNDGTILLCDAKDNEVERYKTGLLDRVLGGGLVKSSVILVGGGPGAGKSTLSLQICDAIVNVTRREALILLAEESAAQSKGTAKRLGIKNLGMIRTISGMGGEDSGEIHFEPILKQYNPAVCIIDSISNLTGDLDVQVDMCKTFKEYAAKLLIPFFVICHVTKAEDFAGLKKMEHVVDTCLTFNKDDTDIRVMKTEKNRFGPNVSEFFDMGEKGLVVIAVCEVCGRRKDDCECNERNE